MQFWHKTEAKEQLTIEVQYKFNALVVCKARCDVEIVERRVLVIEIVEVIDDQLIGLFTHASYVEI